MTPEQYYIQVKRLGLTPSNIRTIFVDSDSITYGVPLPYDMTPEQRVETIEKLKANLGVSSAGD